MYRVKTPNGVRRRNRQHLRLVPESGTLKPVSVPGGESLAGSHANASPSNSASVANRASLPPPNCVHSPCLDTPPPPLQSSRVTGSRRGCPL